VTGGPTIISQVIVPAAAPQGGSLFDLIALATLKDDLKITQSGDDAFLHRAITRASRAIARYCNRTFQAQSYQEQFWALRDPYPWQLPSGFMPLQLGAWPLASPPSLAGTAPPLAPALSAVAGGSLAAATYYARVSYVTPTGETAASMESTLAVAANNLLVVAAPIPDNQAVATGWNVYVGSKSYGETKQNATPIGMEVGFTLPTGGLIAGTAVPNFILVMENVPLAPTPLAEGIDFISDYDPGPEPQSKGWLTRLFQIDENPRRWSGLPILVQYQAGYAQIPDDLADAVVQLVKGHWFARTRDPMIRQESVAGVYEAQWFFASGPGSRAQFPPDVEGLIDQFRVPVIG
jgi:hypothetical protein